MFCLYKKKYQFEMYVYCMCMPSHTYYFLVFTLPSNRSSTIREYIFFCIKFCILVRNRKIVVKNCNNLVTWTFTMMNNLLLERI